MWLTVMRIGLGVALLYHIRMRYGCDDDKKATLEKVGNLLRITTECIRQIEAKTVLKMRRSEEFAEIADLFNR